MEYVFTLIHGTFVPRATWIHDPSLFTDGLRRELGGDDVHFVEFRWSGKLSHGARMDAANQLAVQLAQTVAQVPHARHFIVAHSHGGNVALSALHESAAPFVAGTICLSTPFIHVQERPLATLNVASILFCLAVGLEAVLLSLVPSGILWAIYSFIEPAFWVIESWIVMLLLLVLNGALAYAAADNLHERAVAFASSLPTPTVNTHGNLLVIRRAGDEASLGLGVVQLLGWVSARWSNFMGRIVQRVQDALIPEDDRAGAVLGIASAVIVILGLTFVGLNDTLASYASSPKVLMHAPLLLVACALVIVGLAVLLSIPSLFGGAIAAVAFGPALLGPGLFFEITAEANPPGRVTTEQLSSSSSDGLHHSSYDDPRTWSAIVQWVRRQSGAPRLDGQQAV